MVVESGAQDVFFGVEDSFASISLTFLDHGVVVCQSSHAKSSSFCKAESPEALVEFHV